MDLSSRIQDLIEPSVDELGFDVVRVQMSGKDTVSMQIMVERKDGQGMTVDDCASVSRAISTLLEVDDPIKGAYTLEVSSPGIDRPLVRIRDFERFLGFQAKIEINQPLDGRRRFKGELLGVKDDVVRILVEGVEVNLPHPDIHKAKLLMTDDLIAAAEEN
ncbi:MAG TPA: ribosome maturation factor RimP [Rhodospirillales bacterium]|nr:ribosome maturation factor RimP [Rhodospirillales bacterium]